MKVGCIYIIYDHIGWSKKYHYITVSKLQRKETHHLHVCYIISLSLSIFLDSTHCVVHFDSFNQGSFL